MSTAVGSGYQYEDFVSLKARVKAEMTRRSSTGSLSQYAGSDYDYTSVPTKENPILPEHYNKLITPLNAINVTGFTTVAADGYTPALSALETFLTNAEAQPMSGTSSDCASSCSGLCVSCTGTCVGRCSSCSGSCSGGCSGCTGSCSGGCTGNCTGGCSVCSGTCKGGCTATCTVHCGSVAESQLYSR